jgi:hypothetical protein
MYAVWQCYVHLYPDFYKNILVPTYVKFWNIKLYTDAFIESTIAVTSQTHISFACVRCLQTPILMVTQSGKILLTWVGAFHIHENSFSHFYSNMTLCVLLPCHLVHSCICSGNDLIIQGVSKRALQL